MKFKKIAITGHTKGLGNGLQQHFLEHSLEVVGFSRSNSYDISKIDVIDSIIEETLDYEVFINNAYYENHQSIIASKWFESHKDKPHLLVNISSIAPVTNSYLEPKYIHEKYSKHKSNLDKISWDINFANCKARCINVSPALIDTDMAHPLYIERFRNNGTVISVLEMSNTIADLIEQYFTSKWFVPHIYFINNDNFN